METRFIEGGEYVDRATYIETRDENTRLRERISKLEAKLDVTLAENRMLKGDYTKEDVLKIWEANNKAMEPDDE